MKNSRLLRVLGLVAVLLCSVQSWAGHDTHYGKVTVTAIGNGTVYIDKPEQKEEVTWNCEGRDGNDEKTYSLFAQPDDHYQFVGWSGPGSSNTSPYSVSVKAVSTDANNPSKFDYTATFSQVKHYGKVVVETNDPNGLVFVDTKNDKLAGALINGSTQQEFDCGGVKSGDTKIFYLHTHDIADKRKLNRIEKIVNGVSTTVYTRSGDTNVASAIANVQVSADAAGTQASPTVTTFRFVFDLMCYGEIGVTTNNGNGGSAYVSTSATVPGTETSITWNNGYDAAKKAKTVYLHAVPKSGYVFSGWTGDGTFSDNPHELTVTAEGSKEDPTFKSYTANFSKLETYYSQLNVNVVGEGGTVLVSRTANSSGTYAATSTLGILSQSSSGSANHTYYVYNKPAQDYLFDGYYSDKDCTKPLTLSNGTYSIGATSNSSARPTIRTIYAKFKRIYTYSATVKVAGDGGTATVNGKAVDTQSETTEVVKTVNYSFKLVAGDANPGYEFKGWARSLEGEIVTTDNPFTRTITCDSEEPGKIEDWFAIFEQEDNQTDDNVSYINPILNADTEDPSVILGEDGYYYLYGSEMKLGEGIPVWRSADLINWTCITYIFATRPSTVSDKSRLLSPDIAYVNGKYLLYYSCKSTGENTEIHVASSDKPYGPFSSDKALVTNDYAKAPSLFQDADTKRNYLVYGENGVYYIQLNSLCTGVASGASATKIGGNASAGEWAELKAPVVIKHKANDGKTYTYLLATRKFHKSKDEFDNKPRPKALGQEFELVCARTSGSLSSTFYDQDGRDVFTRNGKGTMLSILKTNNYVLSPAHNTQILTVKNLSGETEEWILYHGYSWDGKKQDLANLNIDKKQLFAEKIEWEKWYAGFPGLTPPTQEPLPIPVVDTEKQKEASYKIYNATDLVNFATEVNEGRANFSNALLMNDIDCSTISSWTPIGAFSDKIYRGVIDGQGHQILNLKASRDNDAALVSYAGGGASFKNIIVHSSCSFASKWNTAGSFVAIANGPGSVNFENCGNEANVSAGWNAGGFVGKTEGSVQIEFKNCYNLGDIVATGNTCATFVASSNQNGTIKFTNCWNNGESKIETSWSHDNAFFAGSTTSSNITIANCYDLKNVSSTLGKPANYTDAWLENGHFTFFMNEQNNNKIVWYQKLGEDEHPILFSRGGDRVYKAIGCNGKHATTGGYNEGGYTNSNRGASHVYEFVLTSSELSKKCKNCSNLYSSITVPRHSDGFLEVSNADQMELSMDFISAGRTVAIESGNEVGENEHGIDVNIRLMQDIDFRAKGTKYYGLANDGKRFVSVFDGQFHHVTVNYTTKYAYTGLFSGLHDATVKNLYLDGTITNEKYQYVGSLFGYANNSTIEKCLSSVSITDKSNITDSEVYIGGIGGRAIAGTKINNCGFVGNISSLNANNVSGIVELVSNVVVTITNSYVSAKINAKSVKDFAPELSKVTVTNCYSYAPDAEEVTGGKLCYKLNQGQPENVWKQTIGVQLYPVFEGDEVNWDEGADVYYNDVYIREGLKDGDFFTICLDKNAALFEGGEVYSIAGKRKKDGGEVSSLMLYGRDEMLAGEPYIVRATSDVFKVCLTGKKATEAGIVNGLRGTFVDFPFGTWSDYEKENAADGVFVLTNNILKRASAKSGVKAYRAFLIMSKVEDKPELLQNAGVKLFNLDFEGMNDDVETSIEMTDVDFAEVPVYNLQGQRVFKPSHGIFIVNGKKVFVK